MLILAGVTINLALGDNGLIGYARNAKDETKKAEEKEISEQEEAILKIKAMQEIKVADVDEEPGV